MIFTDTLVLMLPITIGFIALASLHTNYSNKTHSPNKTTRIDRIIAFSFLLPLFMMSLIVPWYKFLANNLLLLIALYFVYAAFHINRILVFTISLLLLITIAVLLLLNFYKTAEYIATFFFISLLVGIIKDSLYSKLFRSKNSR